MKKILGLFVVFTAIVLMVSCGSEGKSNIKADGTAGGKCYENKTCDEGLTCDEENNVCIKDEDSDITSDIDNDTPVDTDDSSDTAWDGSDSVNDDTPVDTDTEDDPNEDIPADDPNAPQTPCNPNPCRNITNATGKCSVDEEQNSYVCKCKKGYIFNGASCFKNSANLQECSSTNTTTCLDSETGLIWSEKSAERLRWIDAVEYCKNLNEGGLKDWRLPTVAVLRTLVKDCNSSSGCAGDTDGNHSKLGDIVFLWSSNGGSSSAEGVYFYNGATVSKNIDDSFDVRCVHREGADMRSMNCPGIFFENSEYNTASHITQFWSWDTASWFPGTNISYNEEESANECRFKCEDGLCKNYSSDLKWSSRAENSMTWANAVNYCDTLEEGDYNNWFLPTIDHLRTLVRDRKTVTGGECKVSEADECLSVDDCWSYETCAEACDPSSGTCNVEYSDGRYSKFWETGYLWSSSVADDGNIWVVAYDNGMITRVPEYIYYQEYNYSAYNTLPVRCATLCENNYWWDSETDECVNPCDANPCGHGECTATGAKKYSCECEENYFFDEETGGCVNPCNSNPCGQGICTPITAGNYSCECDANYFFDTNSGRCVNPCKPINPCGGHGTCTPTSFDSYSCSCESNYFIDSSSYTCVSPCDPNPCTAITNSQCTATSATKFSCSGGTDPNTGLLWSDNYGTMSWSSANSYCLNNGWRLPTVSELRTLINNCTGTITNSNGTFKSGTCGVWDDLNYDDNDCLSSNDCYTESKCQSCTSDSTGRYSKFGETGNFWSSSPLTESSSYVWNVNFTNASVNYYSKTSSTYYYVRCVYSD